MGQDSTQHETNSPPLPVAPYLGRENNHEDYDDALDDFSNFVRVSEPSGEVDSDAGQYARLLEVAMTELTDFGLSGT